ncbi:acyl-CoA dehydrogenase family protein [Sphingobium boeckii]|uniref:Acyl-[acyl-carrier-protein] dehydrogenase MbtN n=1 Tax=Sphingobium boeckii TaxID=1082345 RepID=A0A7W9EDV4_9SPHN|nr:acyl-CoA dehydrogenase family protein [Sphingobium boeckii]MBB5685668.1 acyl-CoA dehydrogenase [Sphingobium boeckii]
MDDELNLLSDQVARFIASDLLPDVSAWESQRQITSESWKKVAAAGLFCASIPEEYGGGGGTLAHEAVILQELSRAGLGGNLGVAHSIHSGIVAHYILAYGTEEQRGRWLPGMAQGDVIGAIAMTEPGAGSDLKGIRTSLSPCEGGWRLNGQKTFITNGQTANLILVAARLSGSDGALSLAVVETETADGFRRGRNLDKLGMHAQDTSELFFDDVFIPADHLLGETPGQGFYQLMQQLAWERMTIAQSALINMERGVELATDYALQRDAFGKLLFDFQSVQFTLANAKTQATVGRAFFDQLMVQLLNDDLDDALAAMAKLWLTETAFTVIDACQQLFGGYGYMMEYPITNLFADSRVMRVYGGTSEIMKVIIARSIRHGSNAPTIAASTRP